MWTFLETIGWLCSIVYATIPSFWLLIHPRVDYWRLREGSPHRLLLPVWMGMWIVLGVITAPWRHVVLYSARWTWIPAIALFAAGLWFYKNSGKQFSCAQLSGLAELQPERHEQRLVTSGIRSRIRHPVYLGHLCEMLAWSIGTGLVVGYGLTGFAMITGAIMIRWEDAELETRFGGKFRAYREKVPALLPKISA
jgi:protein-S-isoprenylcysteine O-methyltransferase Ste14